MIIQKINFYWYHFNIYHTIPLILLTLVRLRKPHKKNLKTDYIDYYCTFIYSLTILFYIIDIFFKTLLNYYQDVCEQAFLIHHAGAIIIIFPLVYNILINWSAIAIGFMHSLLFQYPHKFWLNIPYVFIVLMFHYSLYQVLIFYKYPYRQLPGYSFSRVFMFTVYFSYILLGWNGCRNQLLMEY